MTYHTHSFTAASLRDLSDAVSAYLAANLTFVPVNLAVVAAGQLYNAILLYGV